MSKKSYVIAFVIFVIALTVIFFMGRSNKVEAPTDGNNVVDTTNSGAVPNENNSTTAEPVIKDGVKEFTITGKNFLFIPSAINVKQGDKVRIIFENTEGFHDLRIDEYGVATKQAKAPYQEILEFTASKAGTFEYYCSVGAHRAMGMKGTLTVE